MTTGKDNFENRLSSEDWGIEREFSVGVPIDGSADPTGEYPKRDYFYSSSISQAARGAKVNDLWYGGSYYGINFDIFPQKGSIFPFSQTNETPSGHSFEIDDTPGAERILFKHRTGAGIEIKPDGSVVVSSRQNKIEVVNGDNNVVVSGSGSMVYEGNLDLEVRGNYNVLVGGNYNVEVGSNHKQNILGSHRTEVGKTSSYVTRGSKSTKTYLQNVDLTLGTYHQIVNDNITILGGGDQVTNINGRLQKTATDYKLTADNINMVSRELRVAAQEGIIGGKELVHYGRTFTGPDSDGATGGGVTYYGSLVGRAFEAWTAKYSIYADEAFQAHISNFATKADQADDAYRADFAEGANLCNTPKNDKNPAQATQTAPSTNDYPPWSGGSTTHDGSKKVTVDPTFNYGVGREGGGADTGIVWKVNQILEKTLVPDSDNTNIYIEESNSGVRTNFIDTTGGLSYKIAKIRYEGYFDRDPKIYEIRSKLRSFPDPSAGRNEKEESCVQELLKQGRLNATFSTPAPQGINGEIVTKQPSKIFGNILLGNPNENKSKSFKSFLRSITARTITPDPRYNVDAFPSRRISSATKLAKGVTLGRFLGSPGNRTSLDYIPKREERLQLARNLYLHAHLLEIVNSNPRFKKNRLIVSEGVYVPSSVENTSNNHGINELKKTGRAVVYQVLNSAGKVDHSRTFDLCVYLKDHFFFEKIILDYDTYSPRKTLSSQIVVIIPNIPESYEISCRYDIETHFNRHVYSPTDLVKILPEDV